MFRRLAAALAVVLSAALLALVPSSAQADGFTISGALVDTGGNAAEAFVDLYVLDNGSYIPWGGPVFGANGSYEFTELPVGSYKVGVGDNEGLYVPEFYDDVATLTLATPVVVTNADRGGIDFELAYPGATGSIAGTVTAAVGGADLEDITVTAYDGDTFDVAGSASTDADGTYQLELPAGTYRVGFSDTTAPVAYAAEYHHDQPSVDLADDVVVEAADTELVDAALAVVGTVVGTVQGNADGSPGLDPLAGIDVTLYQEGGDGWGEVASDTTDGEGEYEIAAGPGTYRLGFAHPADLFAEEFYDNQPSLDVAADVVLAPDTELTRNAVLAKQGTLSGTVTDDLTDEPLAGITVVFRRNLGTTGSPSWVQVDEVTTTLSGQYQRSLDPGAYRVEFVDEDGLHRGEHWNDELTLGAADTISVPGDGASAPAANAQLSPAAIAGTVTGPHGTAIPGVLVNVYENGGTPEDPAWDVIATTVTVSGGRYAVSLAAGDYRVGFEPPADGPWQGEWYADKLTVEAADTVTVALGQGVVTVDAELFAPEVVILARSTISGTPRVGRTLTASVPTWSPAGATTSYQWKADGTPIAGATARTLELTGAQVGKRITVTTSGSRTGYLSGSATSAPTRVVTVVPRVRVKASNRNRVVKLVITVKAAGVRTVIGKVKVLRGGSVLKTVRLKRGKVTVRLTRQPRGKQRYTVKYLGRSPVRPARTVVKVAV